MYAAHAQGGELSQADLLAEIQQTLAAVGRHGRENRRIAPLGRRPDRFLRLKFDSDPRLLIG